MKTFIYTFAFIFITISFTSCITRVHTKPAYKTTKIVRVAPKGHKIIYVKGQKYYKWNNKHYRKTHRGYVVVRL